MNKQSHRSILVEDLGLQPYQAVRAYQQQLFGNNLEAKRKNLSTVNTLLLCEHLPVITIGKNGKRENLLFTEEQLQQKNIQLFRTDRGGDITYHGPGQLVAYPIFDIENFGIGLKKYIRMLEEVMITLLSIYNVAGERYDNAPGIWLDTEYRNTRKIGAIGVYCSRFITMHGFALNINTDLSCFSYINPCGFTDKGVTSLQKETGVTLPMNDIKRDVQLIFEELFLSLKEK